MEARDGEGSERARQEARTAAAQQPAGRSCSRRRQGRGAIHRRDRKDGVYWLILVQCQCMFITRGPASCVPRGKGNECVRACPFFVSSALHWPEPEARDIIMIGLWV